MEEGMECQEPKGMGPESSGLHTIDVEIGFDPKTLMVKVWAKRITETEEAILEEEVSEVMGFASYERLYLVQKDFYDKVKPLYEAIKLVESAEVIRDIELSLKKEE